MLTAAIGLSRVYLGVHYFSDVAGGWALGRHRVRRLRRASRWSITHLRHNPPPERELMTSCVAKIGTEYLLFGGAGLISLLAFAR